MNESRPEGTTIWMVRHGESTWNERGLVQGQAEGPRLTAAGVRQSEAVAAQFQDRTIGAIYSSDLERACQTAACIGSALGLPVIHFEALRERCFGVHEGLPLSSLETAASGIEGDRVVDATARPEGGESLDEVYERVGAFLEWVDAQHVHGDVIVVSHGGAIRAMRAFSAGVPMKESPWETVANSSVWRIHRRPAVPSTK
jgi:broad specificity phosphatase PhoE